MAEFGTSYESFDIAQASGRSSPVSDSTGECPFSESGDMDGVEVQRTSASIDHSYWVRRHETMEYGYNQLDNTYGFRKRSNWDVNWSRVCAGLSSFGAKIADLGQRIRNAKLSFCSISAFCLFRSHKEPASAIEVAIDRGLRTTAEREKVPDFELPQKDSLTRHKGGTQLLESQKQEVINHIK